MRPEVMIRAAFIFVDAGVEINIIYCIAHQLRAPSSQPLCR